MLSRAWFLIALGTAILLPLHAIWLIRTSEFYGGLNLLLGWTGHDMDQDQEEKLSDEARSDLPAPRGDLHTNIKDLIASVEQYLSDTYGPPQLRRLPPGLRLEIHPAVYRHIRCDPEHYLWPEEMRDVTKRSRSRTRYPPTPGAW